MSDQRTVNLARILVQYSTKVQPNDLVAIVGQPPATPLIQELFREVLRAGGHPYVFVRDTSSHIPGLEGLDHILFSEANDDQLQHVDLIFKKVIEEFDVWIKVQSDYNTRSRSTIAPARLALRDRAHTSVLATYRERAASGDLRRVITLFPTEAYAQDAEMSLTEFEDYVYSTTYADTDDPVGEWNSFHDFQQRLIDWLAGKKEILVQGPNVDLSLSIEGRPFLNADGTRNMPSGEIFTSPIEDSANGWIRFDYPVVTKGREVEGVELSFENGKVVKASAKKDEAFLLSMLDTDAGSRFLGEFAIGTNKKIQRFIKNILFDEKIGGTIHVALGAGFPEIGGKNVSALHWDMICDMRGGGQISVDGELFYDSGDFKV